MKGAEKESREILRVLKREMCVRIHVASFSFIGLIDPKCYFIKTYSKSVL